MLPPRSLQNRLLLSFLLSMMAILAAGGFVIYTVIQRHLESENDALLSDRLNIYTAALELTERRGLTIGSYTLAFEQRVKHEQKDTGDLFQAWLHERGVPIPYRPQGLRDEENPTESHDLPRILASGEGVSFADHTLWDGRPARLCSRVFVPRKTKPELNDVKVQLVVGRDLLTLHHTLHDVRWFLVKMGAAVMGGILVISWLIIRRGVQPVKKLAHQIEAVPLTEAGAHFALPGAPTELQPVVGRLNALMDRVSDAIEHERQFANNAAHELRNPLAAIRSSIELSLSRTREPEEYEATLESILTSQQGMQRIVDHLLLLARLESGHRQSEFVTEPAVLGKMLKKAWLNCVELAAERKLRVTWQVEQPEAELVLALSLTGSVFTNLMENAVAYTPAGGEVRLSAVLRDGACHFAVENTNPGLRAEQLEDSFTPFWRADPNASGHRGNAGIGLALCRRICQTLGGGITGALTPEGLVRYAVQIPVIIKAAPSAARPPA